MSLAYVRDKHEQPVPVDDVNKLRGLGPKKDSVAKSTDINITYS